MALDGIAVAALLAVAGTAGFVLRHYVGPYAAEKGRNLATKEDIGRITEEIEKVKVAVQTFGQLKTDYEQQRRQWLLTFYDAAIQMLYDKFAVTFGDFPFDEGRSLFAYQQDFRLCVSELAKAYQRIVLYFQHQDPLRVHAEAVLTAALEARKIMTSRFGAIKTTFVEEELAFRTGDRARMESAVEETNRANTAYWDEMHPVAERFQTALRSYLTALNKFLSDGAGKIT